MRLWSEQVDDEEAEAAQLAAATSSAAAQEEIWTTFQDVPMEAPSPTFMPEPPVYTDVRQGPHRYSEHDIYEGIVEEEPPSTDHLPDAATLGAMPLEPEDDTDAVTHAFEPRGMSSFQNHCSFRVVQATQKNVPRSIAWRATALSARCSGTCPPPAETRTLLSPRMTLSYPVVNRPNGSTTTQWSWGTS